MKLTDAIEDLDDVQEVFTNADLDNQFLNHEQLIKERKGMTSKEKLPRSCRKINLIKTSAQNSQSVLKKKILT